MGPDQQSTTSGSDLRGNVTDLRGNVSGLWGDVSDLRGDVDDAALSPEEREQGVDVAELVT